MSRAFSRARVEPRVFENAGLVGDVQKIAVHRIRLLRAGLHRNLLRFAIRDHLRAAGKLLAIPLLPPRRDDLQLRRERGGGQFEAHLVVALARRAVRDGVAPSPPSRSRPCAWR